MAYCVYIIQSQKDGTFYKGSSECPDKRLHQHNNGKSQYTKTKMPWTLVYVEQCLDKKSMLIREKKLKRGNKQYFESLIHSDKNILHQFQQQN